MILRRFLKRADPTPLLTPQLYDERSFYTAFLNDLGMCKRELILESPFITHKRMTALYPSLRRLTKRGVRIVINTRDPKEHNWRMEAEAEAAIASMQEIGVKVLFTDNHHRKLAIIDREVLYEGSLNILSQNASCEVMRRIVSRQLVEQMLDFLNIRTHF